ncbi:MULTISPECIES: nitroreductase family protein [Paenibacillus]|uniref:Putative NAD(P)H nitroreductase n=1 Tax=Paenibacillus popilliae TaxID=78057 RepID=A0ABY3AR18_PAEPP|nr:MULTISPECIES: nitroreductase [Paenibacillus]MCM3292558.1 nitroreductase [Paenibacillus sp. MER 180]OBY78703.1 nitroreductase [Paenibacillus sp. KS1]TQR44741.1 nitroreductase [Paenibacillus sp. SDF0028]
MSIASIIRERRSIHEFNDKPVDRSLVLQLLNDAVWAPNHGLREPWRFIYAEGEGKARIMNGLLTILDKTKLRDATPEQRQKFEEHLMHVPAYLHVVMPEDPRPNIWQEDLEAVSALIQNFQLLGWEHGLGMLWHTGDYIYNKQYREMVGVQPGEKLVGVIRIGYFDDAPKARPRTSAEQLFTVIDQ